MDCLGLKTSNKSKDLVKMNCFCVEEISFVTALDMPCARNLKVQNAF